MLAAPEVLRILVVGDCHAVALAALVPAPLELADNEISLHDNQGTILLLTWFSRVRQLTIINALCVIPMQKQQSVRFLRTGCCCIGDSNTINGILADLIMRRASGSRSGS